MSSYENHNLDNKSLPFIFKERREYPQSDGFVPTNWHENVEVIRINSGNGILSNNGEEIRVSVGDIAVINKNGLHSIFTREDELDYHYLIVDRSFCLANGFDTSEISFDTLVRDNRVLAAFRELEEAYSVPEDALYRAVLIRSCVLRLMYLLCSDHASHGTVEAYNVRVLSYVKDAIAYLRASYDRDVSLDDAARFVGVNKFYLSREFHKYTGQSFVSYLNRVRCGAACELLSEGRISVAEVGERCGFRNRSYFAKIFRRYVGTSPAKYKPGRYFEEEEEI